jgi:hypothetical protein
MDSLRNEIVESQKMRIDLMKWKLILVAVIGAVGLGLNAKSPRPHINTNLLLCLIPFVIVYVDLLCQHLLLRIYVISKYLSELADRGKTDEITVYEHFAQNARRILPDGQKTHQLNVFRIEDFAVTTSSNIILILLIIYAVFLCPLANDTVQPVVFTSFLPKTAGRCLTPLIIVFFSLSGLVITGILNSSYKKRRKSVLGNEIEFPPHELKNEIR